MSILVALPEVPNPRAIPGVIRALLLAPGAVCLYCGDFAEEIDHIIPVTRGGTGDPTNLAPACYPCNREKSDLLLVEWRPELIALVDAYAANAEQQARRAYQENERVKAENKRRRPELRGGLRARYETHPWEAPPTSPWWQRWAEAERRRIIAAALIGDAQAAQTADAATLADVG